MKELERKILYSVGKFLDRSAFFQRVFARLLLGSPVIPAKIYPYEEGVDAWWTDLQLPASTTGNPEELPVPPPELWEGYGKTPEQYLDSGREHVMAMREIVGKAGLDIDSAGRVLEFGCSAGRMIRWFAPVGKGREIWGVDIASKPIHWAIQHLAPPFYFATNTTLPPLPFEGGAFQFIYAGSVFTHIADLADLWLIELRRLLKPSGLLYVTVHDKHTLDLLLAKYPGISLTRTLQEANARTGCLQANFAKLVLARSPKGAQVFYDISFLRQHWGRLLEVVSVTNEAYGYQTAVLFRKS
jgi:SAM-dependent methyltransferase